MGDDGSKLWLRYAPLGAPAGPYEDVVRHICVAGDSGTARIIRDELRTALTSLLGRTIGHADLPGQPGTVYVGTPTSSDVIRSLGWEDEIAALGSEGFVIRSTKVSGQPSTVIAAGTQIGALYGAFAFLRLVQTCQPIDQLSITQRPRVQHRMLNHWDNLDGSIERGYAGGTLWQWDDLPDKIDPRYTDYARANASIGINGSVVNNVNTNPLILSPVYLRKVAALADIWRPFGIRVYLAVNFASPMQIGGLDSNDPVDARVQQWWRDKVDEIYQLIPDFGGFVIKANSEGQPGPQDYGRTHADGANMLADAIVPHRGIIMWRAFVYNEEVDPDRIKRAYIEFTALDGKFRDNVAVQVKNGPLDFMPREPFHPLFGAMTKSPVWAEFQAAQEYLGHSKHLVYHGPMWKQVLDADTYAKGPLPGATVGRVLDGSIHPYHMTGIVAVANTGTDTNWCGHEFSQANWYAFGRLSWNHELSAERIAEEWVRMTLTHDPQAIRTIVDMMMSSHETFVSYTMPLGLHHLIGGDHYEPMPWVERHEHCDREDWTATFYHRADESGVGVDRSTSGTGAVSQYFPPLCDEFNSPETCPDELLLWFHRLPWDYKMRSGNTLWKALCNSYYRGHEQAKALAAAWKSLVDQIDPGQHKRVSDRLAIQVQDSAKWRDECLAYFQKFSGMPMEPGE